MSTRDKRSLVLLLVLVTITTAELYVDPSSPIAWIMIALTVVAALRFAVVLYSGRNAASHPPDRS
jgi:hypothetical protein